MNPDFIKASKGHDWITWCGGWLLYDGGLCVNRSPEEHAENNKHKYNYLEYPYRKP